MALSTDGEITVWRIAFSSDSKTLAASAIADNGSELLLWDISSGRRLVTRTYKTMLAGVAFSPDGKTLALETDSGMIFLLL